MLVSTPTFCYGNTFSLTLEMVRMKYTYFLMTQNVKYEVQSTLSDSNYTLYHQTIAVVDSLKTWLFHLNGGKMSSIVDNASEVCFLSDFFLESIRRKLRSNQQFVTAGGLNGTLRNQAMYVTLSQAPQSDPRLTCNAEESDTRIWLHVVNSSGLKKLVLRCVPYRLTYCCWFIFWSNGEAESIHLTWEQVLQALVQALVDDPDVAPIPNSLFPSAVCVYRVWFYIILSNPIRVQQIHLCSDSRYSSRHRSQLKWNSVIFRLVGCAYFRKHKAAFLPTYPTPMSLFNSLAKGNQTHVDHHSAWLSFLRERVWSRIKYEEEMIPSDGALARHWQRSCCVETINTEQHNLSTTKRKWLDSGKQFC